MHRRIGVGCLIAAALAAAPLGAEGPTRGQILADGCMACHGPSGRGADAMPPLRGYNAEELLHTMQRFREQAGDEGASGTTVMNRHAAGYTDEDLRAIARALSRDGILAADPADSEADRD